MTDTDNLAAVPLEVRARALGAALDAFELALRTAGVYLDLFDRAALLEECLADMGDRLEAQADAFPPAPVN